MNYQSIIEDIRSNYQKNPKKKFKLRFRLWINLSTLNRIYSDQKFLARSGKIVYAHLIQANSLLFKKRLFGGDLPAVLLYSMEPYYDEHPEELRKLAREIFSYKNKKDAPLELQKFADLISNELSSEYNLILPSSITPHGKVYYSTFVVWRKHLIDNYLKNSLFPIFAAPDRVKSCMIVPKQYWSEEYKYFYNNKAFPKEHISKEKILLNAFPIHLKDDVEYILSILPNKTVNNIQINFKGGIEYNCNNEIIKIPYRIYNEELEDSKINELSKTQQKIYHCLYSRSFDGFAREKHIDTLLSSEYEDWVIPYIIHLCSEYVIDILDFIYEKIQSKDNINFKNFCLNNKFALYKNYCRMYSYHRQYYKNIKFNNYIGRKLFLECFGYNSSFRKNK